MSDWDTQWERAEQRADEDLDMTDEEEVPMIGRITQLTPIEGISTTAIRPLTPLPRRPNGQFVRIQPLYMLYVFRQNGQAGMIVNRGKPFQYEQMYLTELEMAVVMKWASKMNIEHIGRFSPADGGWMWWQK